MHKAKNKLKICEYFSRLIKKYHELYKEVKSTPAYQIRETKLINSNYKLFVHINGTGKILSLSPHEIAGDPLFLKEFSTTDMQTILRLAFKESKLSLYTIASHKLSEKGEQSIFCLRTRSSGETQELTAAEISMNKDFLNQLSPLDAYRVGYTYGLEEAGKGSCSLR